MLIVVTATTKTIAAPAFVRQDTSVITLRLTNEPLDRAFREIKRQTPYRVLYANGLIDRAKKVTISLEKVSLTVALKELLKGQSFTYTIDGKNIIIVPKKTAVRNDDPDILAIPSADVELAPITGLITDSLGNPLAGASITIQGKGTTTVSDASGRFSIEASVGDVLLVSFVGYENQRITVRANQSLSIHLTRKVSGLDEITVVSTGYQEIPKERATGSFVQINNELLNRTVSTNVLDRLYTITSGLNYNPKNSGSAIKSTINIRGISTINTDMKPLIVIDGFPYDEGTIANGAIYNVNPNDIESITVLRDAAAASIWGARSGNGVIVITTKKGKYNQRTNIQFNSSVTTGEKPNLYDFPIISSKDYLGMEKILFSSNYYQSTEDMSTYGYPYPLSQGVELLIAKRDGLLPETEADDQLSALENHRMIDDIYRYMLKESINQQYAINVSGGGEKFHYYASIGLDKNRNSTIGNNLTRWSMRLDNTYKPSKKIEIGNYIVYTQNGNENAGIDITSLIPTGRGVVQVAPYSRLMDQHSNSLAIPKDYRLGYVDTASYPSLLDWHYRPIDELRHTHNTSTQYSTRIGATIKYIILPGLNISVRSQYEKSLTPERSYKSLDAYYTRDMINLFTNRQTTGLTHPVPVGGIVDIRNIELTSWNIRGQADFVRQWNQFQLNALAGWEASEFEYDIRESRDYGYNDETKLFSTNMDYNNSFLVSPWQSGRKILNGDGYNGTLRRLISYYLNGGLTYKNKYTLSLSSRLDGANLFGVKTNEKILPLWSGGLAWSISREEFYKISWLPLLKIRLSHGYNGNMKNDATRFATISYSPRDPILGIPIATIISPPNDNLKWERIGITNIGLDFSVINRIRGSIEYYHKKGLDLISSIQTDPTTGVSSYIGNNASIKGRGVDVILNILNTIGKLSWTTDLLFSYNTDEVISYSIAPAVRGLTAIDGSTNPYIGKPLYSVFSFKWAGLDPTNGDPKGYVEGSATSYNEALLGASIESNDVVYNGPISPRFFGSVRNSLSWRNFDLSINILYKLHSFFKRASVNYSNLFNNWSGHSDYSLRWQKPGDELDTNVPSMPATSNYNRDAFYAESEILVESGSHFRLQDIRLSYDIGRRPLKRFPLKNAQVYIYANNLGMIWSANKYGINPDYGEFVIPPQRTISIGLTANL